MVGFQEFAVIALVLLAIFIAKTIMADSRDDERLGCEKLAEQRTKLRLKKIESPVEAEIIRRFLRARDLRFPAIELYTVDIDDLNAMAQPGGVLLFTRQMWAAFRIDFFSTEELAAVIAHEIGHSELSHWRRRIKSNAMGEMISGIVFWKKNLIAREIGRYAIDKGVGVLSHKDEYEADRFALDLLVDAGYGAQPLISLLEKFLDPEVADFQYWLTRHPPTRERIRRIRALCKDAVS